MHFRPVLTEFIIGSVFRSNRMKWSMPSLSILLLILCTFSTANLAASGLGVLAGTPRLADHKWREHLASVALPIGQFPGHGHRFAGRDFARASRTA